ncbi:MAG: hypothetical protein BJ554DRAFT_6553, partial [Olpidium bornovanus]
LNSFWITFEECQSRSRGIAERWGRTPATRNKWWNNFMYLHVAHVSVTFVCVRPVSPLVHLEDGAEVLLGTPGEEVDDGLLVRAELALARPVQRVDVAFDVAMAGFVAAPFQKRGEKGLHVSGSVALDLVGNVLSVQDF